MNERTNEQESGKNEESQKLSKRKRKELRRLQVAELKQIVPKPEVVEVHDITAADPRLLVYLKSYRNAVHVPQHWSQKRKYLQGKRGIEKPLFRLPEFIASTGIASMREAISTTDESKSLKQQQRERMAPRMGGIDIDYNVLHDAFFKYQTKPKMTAYGDLYYEGKEFEAKLQTKRPAQLSDGLKQALGMPEGAPPPWLLNMQRCGPPPSYPNLKIPGLNAPIPDGASWGFQPGQWGKVPEDETGRPLYGWFDEAEERAYGPQDTSLWGEVEEEEEGEEGLEDMEEEEEEESEEGEEEQEEEGAAPPVPSAFPPGMPAPAEMQAGIQSIPSGFETPDVGIDIRKKKDSDRELYQELQTQETSVGSALMGSTFKYVVPKEQQEEEESSAQEEPPEVKLEGRSTQRKDQDKNKEYRQFKF